MPVRTAMRILVVLLMVSFGALGPNQVYRHALAADGPRPEVEVGLWAKGVFVGDPGGDMRWSDGLSRAEAAKVIVVAAGLKAGTSRPVPGLPKDVPSGYWASTHIALGLENGLLYGDEDGSFRPEGRVTMAEYAVMLARLYRNVGGSAGPGVASVRVRPEWAAKEIRDCPPLAKWLGLGSGGEADLDFQISRAQAAILTYNAMSEFGLIYDMRGTVAELSSDGAFFVLDVGGRLVRVGISPEVRVLRGSTTVSFSSVRVNSRVSVTLSDGGVCTALVVE